MCGPPLQRPDGTCSLLSRRANDELGKERLVDRSCPAADSGCEELNGPLAHFDAGLSHGGEGEGWMTRNRDVVISDDGEPHAGLGNHAQRTDGEFVMSGEDRCERRPGDPRPADRLRCRVLALIRTNDEDLVLQTLLMHQLEVAAQPDAVRELL